jgi:hypothetical protein
VPQDYEERKLKLRVLGTIRFIGELFGCACGDVLARGRWCDT